jgi:peptidoglycan/LPS O-acetylase OafA/YrhL
MLSAPLFRWIAGPLAGINDIAVVVMPLGSLDALGIGALFALLQRRQDHTRYPSARVSRLAMAAGIGGLLVFTSAHLLAPRFGSQGVINVLGDSMLAPVALGLVYMTSTGIKGPIGWLLQWGPLVHLGKISYGLYVLHFFVPTMTTRLMAWGGMSMADIMGPVASFALNLLVLVLLSSLSWHSFEKKINELKRYFPYVPPEHSLRRHATATSAVPAAYVSSVNIALNKTKTR